MTDQIPIEHAPNEHNRDYLRAKREQHGPPAAPPGPGARRGDDPRGARARTASGASEPDPASGRPAVADRYAIAVGALLRGAGATGWSRAPRAVFEEAGAEVDVHEVPGRVRAAAGGEVLRRVGPLRGRGLPRRRDPRRDRPLRLRLQRGGARDRRVCSSTPACRARFGVLTVDNMDQALARVGEEAPPGRGRRPRGAADGGCAASSHEPVRSTSTATRRRARRDGMRQAIADGRGGRRAARARPDRQRAAGARGRAARQEAALFLPSGTMCNAIAFRLHIARAATR